VGSCDQVIDDETLAQEPLMGAYRDHVDEKKRYDTFV
jgi:hypothetical protein